MELKEAIKIVKLEYDLHYSESAKNTTIGYQKCKHAFQLLIALADAIQASLKAK